MGVDKINYMTKFFNHKQKEENIYSEKTYDEFDKKIVDEVLKQPLESWNYKTLNDISFPLMYFQSAKAPLLRMTITYYPIEKGVIQIADNEDYDIINHTIPFNQELKMYYDKIYDYYRNRYKKQIPDILHQLKS